MLHPPLAGCGILPINKESGLPLGISLEKIAATPGAPESAWLLGFGSSQIINVLPQKAEWGLYMDFPTKETRNTKQKRFILDCFKKSGGRHMNVEEIYNLIKEHDEKISIATVYRNLKVLEQQGVVKKLYMAEDAPSFYEMNDSDEHAHHHLVCSKCGAILDFEGDLLDSLEKTIEKKKGFKIKDHRVVFYGLCKACQEEENKKNK